MKNDIKYTIIATGYNCEKYVNNLVKSIINQTFKSWELYIYDDGSLDSTFEISNKFKQDNIHIVRNEINQGALKGRYNIIQNKAKGDIICFVGLDDSLRHDALEVLNKYYTDGDVLMTWGSWKDNKGNKTSAMNYSDDVWENRNFRKSSWKATALNTFKKSLIIKVPKEMIQRNGEWLTNCTDLAYSFPCLEMINKSNVRVVKEHIYIYRVDNPISTLKRYGKNHKSEIREYLKTIKMKNNNM